MKTFLQYEINPRVRLEATLPQRLLQRVMTVRRWLRHREWPIYALLFAMVFVLGKVFQW